MQQTSDTSRTLSINRSSKTAKVRRGDVFKWDEGSGIAHYWFVLTNEHEGQYLIANITSMPSKNGTQRKIVDRTCVIEQKHYQNDFSIISQDSFVQYGGMKMFSASELEPLIAKHGQNGSRAPLFLIERMAGGIIVASGTAKKFVNHYKKIKHL